MKEYRIYSIRLGCWPETFGDTDFEVAALAADLAYNRHSYPDVDFIVEEREVAPWVASGLDVPVLAYKDILKDTLEDWPVQ